MEIKHDGKRVGTTFGVKIIDSSSGEVYIGKDGSFEEMREITMEELKELVAKYEQLDVLVEKLSAETHIVF